MAALESNRGAPAETIAGIQDRRVAIVTGASEGLGRVIAVQLIREGYYVAVIGRDREKLDAFVLEQPSGSCLPIACDVTVGGQVHSMVASLIQATGRIDVLVNVVGQSDRGLVADLRIEKLEQLFATNVNASLLCSQACLPWLEESGGVIVNIGSLAAKVGARYLGGYPAAKHALAGLTQQMRLEWKVRGVHVGLLNPGPIRRSDAGARYEKQVGDQTGLPAKASRPGGGTSVKGVPPEKVAKAVLKIIRKRKPDIIMPWHLRPLVAIGHLWPAAGDWLLLKFTR